MRPLRDFLTALGFLSRLGPARVCTSQELASSLNCFGPVGLTLGLCCVAPIYLGLYAGSPLAGAWVILLLNLYLTRFLHCDGLADLADAWGSNARGERFWEIIKDSRLGAFGAVVLGLALGGLLIFYAELLGQGRLGGIIFSLIFGRTLAVALCGLGRKLTRPGLAAQFCAQAGLRANWPSFAFALLCGLFMLGPWRLGLSILLGFALLAGLYGLAGREDGLNGDFLGAAILLGELAACLAAAV